MKKYICFLLIFITMFICGCEQGEYTPPPEQPVMYYKDIDVVVVSNRKATRYAKVRRYEQAITVKSEEYGLEETFIKSDCGAFASMPYWNCKEGDVIKAELYSWKMESTGEITRREISGLK